MNETIRKLFAENKKTVFVMASLVAVGVMFLLFGKHIPEPGEYIAEIFDDNDTPQDFKNKERENFYTEREIEIRLEEFFALVEGAGKVRVLVSPLSGRETVFATDVNASRSHTTEEDSQGGSRETQNHQSQSKTVIITNRQGADTPLILRETEPRVEGIVIIAEGGDCPFVRDALTRAARAVLGAEAHKIQVLKGRVE